MPIEKMIDCLGNETDATAETPLITVPTTPETTRRKTKPSIFHDTGI